ncbi:hypothetical protein [Yinghuangia soli]|uniref:Uncharacterized protein n=1 Tax=Yinghuangia soli TaxID=2908204 RepID=A0AA41PVN1_9ACTN|nr:hypothetical protein [Yinghuangia soli]MCF2526026.1 hypothetical protein [Yinghuangia soli]
MAAVAGCLVLALGLGVGAYKLAGGNEDSESEFPAAEYRIVVPETLMDGAYKLQERPTVNQRDDGTEIPDAKDPIPVAAVYGPATPNAMASTGAGPLLFFGMHGRFRNPDLHREKLLRPDVPQQVVVAVPPRDMTPPGSDVKVGCVVHTGGPEGAYALCAWADDNTLGTVKVPILRADVEDPREVDLAAFARTTLQLRSEVRQPVGTTDRR